MNEILYTAAFGLSLSAAAYCLGLFVQKKTGIVVFNGLIIAGVLISALLLIFDIPYEAYNVGGSVINAFVTPLTVVLAVGLSRPRWMV